MPSKIPPILLEGDRPAARLAGGPGQRYALGPVPSVERLELEGELPEAYGTRRLQLTARDPHWLYAHWDLTGEQQRQYNALSVDRHLILRIHIDAISDRPIQEVHVHPESRHWFVHVETAGRRYFAELGYHRPDGPWIAISTSAGTLTPPDMPSEEAGAEFTTIPLEVPMAKLLMLVKEAAQENVPLAEAIQELREQGHPELPKRVLAPGRWTAGQERALAAIVSMDRVRRVWMGSLEITELIRRQFLHELASMAAAQPGGVPAAAPASPAEAFGGVSSPSGLPAQPGKGFWFNVNAELIVYGATEPDASVTIDGRPVKLRADGSFSYRFALPDGRYEMPVVAVSADGTDGRGAEMKFGRTTEYRGHVEDHPQDPGLRPPVIENF